MDRAPGFFDVDERLRSNLNPLDLSNRRFVKLSPQSHPQRLAQLLMEILEGPLIGRPRQLWLGAGLDFCTAAKDRFVPLFHRS